MAETLPQGQDKGDVLVLRPDEGDTWWQPVPANGHVTVRVAPDRVRMEHPLALGTQTVPPGCHIREHAHDRNEEVIHVIAGTGKAVVEGKEHPIEPGTTLFLGRNRRHMFRNDGEVDLTFVWLIVPNGLETFFEAIGRVRRPDQPAPEPFARPDDVLEIERRTVFAAPPGGSDAPA
ncbi:cupin domain-containing protein [Marinivivus vitaminiproducens]|uniref:cupin domain-containing protein n=1 Tax=Marinivivus vitaminiproducens TaxID=3035935 RepID=UPI002799A4F7|nr:cupin domain-containing protein [Geminicoccaceae bacterium SCSIO 64248]